MNGPRLEGKIVLVTGAGRGIGRGIALAAARQGADIAIAELEPDTAKTSAEEVRSLGVRAIGLACDVGTRAACEEAVAATASELGGIDVLVNNAAWTRTPGRSLLDTTDEDFARTLETNLWATFWMMQASHPHLIERGGGSIVNFASNSGTFGREHQAPYAAAKEGIRGLSRVAAREWGPQGIRVNVICPYANSPGMVAWAETEPETYAASLETIPLKRVGDCEDDIGRVTVFLASDDAAYVTGQTLFVDGGAGSTR